jgi:wobble nucleotide-excising tRNase
MWGWINPFRKRKKEEVIELREINHKAKTIPNAFRIPEHIWDDYYHEISENFTRQDLQRELMFTGDELFKAAKRVVIHHEPFSKAIAILFQSHQKQKISFKEAVMATILLKDAVEIFKIAVIETIRARVVKALILFRKINNQPKCETCPFRHICSGYLS